MTRAEFLAVLSVRLQDIPSDERESALQYYSEYLDEAGPMREETVIAELGGAEKVANIIRANCAGASSIYSDPAPQAEAQEPLRSENTASAPKYNGVPAGYTNPFRTKSSINARIHMSEQKKAKMILWVIIAFLFFPLWSGLVSVVAGLIFSVPVMLVTFCLSGFYLCGIGFVMMIQLIFNNPGTTADHLLNFGFALVIFGGGGLLGIGCAHGTIAICKMATKMIKQFIGWVKRRVGAR